MDDPMGSSTATSAEDTAGSPVELPLPLPLPMLLASRVLTVLLHCRLPGMKSRIRLSQGHPLATAQCSTWGVLFQGGGSWTMVFYKKYTK